MSKPIPHTPVPPTSAPSGRSTRSYLDESTFTAQQRAEQISKAATDLFYQFTRLQGLLLDREPDLSAELYVNATKSLAEIVHHCGDLDSIASDVREEFGFDDAATAPASSQPAQSDAEDTALELARAARDHGEFLRSDITRLHFLVLKMQNWVSGEHYSESLEMSQEAGRRFSSAMASVGWIEDEAQPLLEKQGADDLLAAVTAERANDDVAQAAEE